MTATITAATTKYCSGCGNTKPLEAFYRDRSKRDGRKSWCRECARDYRERNREQQREYSRAHYERNREQELDRKRAHYAANREQVLERQRTYYAANREQVLESDRAYRARNAARTSEEVAAKRAELRPNGVKHCLGRCRKWLPFAAFAVSRANADGLHYICRECDGKQLLKIMALRDNWEDTGGCNYCGARFEEVDHVIPRAAGGEDVPENLVPACKSCNRSKNDRPLFTFLRQLYPDVDLREALGVFTVQVMD